MCNTLGVLTNHRTLVQGRARANTHGMVVCVTLLNLKSIFYPDDGRIRRTFACILGPRIGDFITTRAVVFNLQLVSGFYNFAFQDWITLDSLVADLYNVSSVKL